MMKLLLSAFLGLVGALAATIEVNGVSGSHIVTMENVDPAQMTVHDLRERVVSAKGGPAAGPFLAAHLSLLFGTVTVGPEEYQGDRGQEQPLGTRTRTVAEALNLPRRRLSGKQAAGRLWRVPDRLILTAVFHDVAQRVRDACAEESRALGLGAWLHERPDDAYWAEMALRKALQRVADVLGLQLADREQELERNGRRGHGFFGDEIHQSVLLHWHTEVDWKQPAVAWRQGLVRDNVLVGQVDSLPLMPGAFRWNWDDRPREGEGPANGSWSAVDSVSIDGAPRWVQEAFDACWVAAAEKSGIREPRPVHYAEVVQLQNNGRCGPEGWHKTLAKWQFADGQNGRASNAFLFGAED